MPRAVVALMALAVGCTPLDGGMGRDLAGADLAGSDLSAADQTDALAADLATPRPDLAGECQPDYIPGQRFCDGFDEAGFSTASYSIVQQNGTIVNDASFALAGARSLHVTTATLAQPSTSAAELVFDQANNGRTLPQPEAWVRVYAHLPAATQNEVRLLRVNTHTVSVLADSLRLDGISYGTMPIGAWACIAIHTFGVGSVRTYRLELAGVPLGQSQESDAGFTSFAVGDEGAIMRTAYDYWLDELRVDSQDPGCPVLSP